VIDKFLTESGGIFDMINTNNEKKQIDYLKIIMFFKTSIFLTLIFLGVSTKFTGSNWLLIVFVALLSILCITQVFGVLSISDGYIDRKKVSAKN